MNIGMVASECNPLIKTGGLADVVFALSIELKKLGNDVIIVLPYYKKIKDKYKGNVEHVADYIVEMAWRKNAASVYKTIINGINFYLIDEERYFNRDALYGEFDDGERFAFFTLAAKKLFSIINFVPDIIHVHDWHPGMLPCIIKNENPREATFEKTKFVLTIHNPAFQGLYPKIVLGDLYNLPDWLYEEGYVRFKDLVSTLKAGIVYSDKVTTVSPTHRQELLNPYESMGLADVLRLREWDFCGIANGIDTNEFNPTNDKFIAYSLNEKTLIESKKKNKEVLLERFGLNTNTNMPCFAVVSRLTWQKGVDLIIAASYILASEGCSIVILGSGEYNAEQEFEHLRETYPDRVGIYIGYNNELAHQVYAGADFFMMPSLFEPCGIGQMIAERYGTLPIVRRTGGLKDTVIGYCGNNEDTANGYGFDDYKKEAFTNTCIYAMNNYENEKLHNKLVKNAYLTDNSWESSAKLYLGLDKDITR